MLAEALGVRLEMVVAPSRDELIPWLLEGRGDLVAASLTVTPSRAQRVIFSRPYLYVDEVVVGPAPRGQDAGVGVPTSLAELAGRAIHVRRSSSYYDTLAASAQELGVSIELLPEDLETQEILAMVADGEIPLTVADSHILQVERAYRDDLEPLWTLPSMRAAAEALPARVGLEGETSIAFAMRPDATELARAVDAFVESLAADDTYHVALARYFDGRRSVAARRLYRPTEDGRISRFDPLIRRYAAQYGLDWRLMAALAWRESRFDAGATSWVGALGLFQVMPRTGRALGFTNLRDPEQSTHAGIMYFHGLLARLDPRIPFEERLLFALAGYNAGIGHVGDARRLAARKGLDPNRWFDNVERAMLLLSQPRYHRQARHGYVRGHEPVTHVREIYEQYESFVQLAPP
jgi:membrane-bound lytic murein transglycosylase F